MPHKILFLTLSFAILPSCHPLRETLPPPTSPIPSSPPIPPPLKAPELIPPPRPPQLSCTTLDGITFEGLTFDSRTHRLQVIDQPSGPGSLYPTAQDLAEKTNALLAINAGFFTPQGTPLGLVISSGKSSGSWNSTSSLGSGLYRETPSGTPSITRRSSQNRISGARELLQAGPLLLENGSPISGLEATKTASRSIILTDGKSHWWIGITSPTTLASLTAALGENSPCPWQPRTALNLDGGRSTDLFISGKISGTPLNRRTFLNRPVRNFLILKSR